MFGLLFLKHASTFAVEEAPQSTTSHSWSQTTNATSWEGWQDRSGWQDHSRWRGNDAWSSWRDNDARRGGDWQENLRLNSQP